jgi:hypothetical protein
VLAVDPLPVGDAGPFQEVGERRDVASVVRGGVRREPPLPREVLEVGG